MASGTKYSLRDYNQSHSIHAADLIRRWQIPWYKTFWIYFPWIPSFHPNPPYPTPTHPTHTAVSAVWVGYRRSVPLRCKSPHRLIDVIYRGDVIIPSIYNSHAMSYKTIYVGCCIYQPTRWLSYAALPFSAVFISVLSNGCQIRGLLCPRLLHELKEDTPVLDQYMGMIEVDKPSLVKNLQRQKETKCTVFDIHITRNIIWPETQWLGWRY